MSGPFKGSSHATKAIHSGKEAIRAHGLAGDLIPYMLDSDTDFQDAKGSMMAEENKKSLSEPAEKLQFRQTTDWEPPKEEEPPKRRTFDELPAAAQRALKEAEERRKERDVIKEAEKMPKEVGGRGGLDPTRYDDYEIGGRVIDF